MKKISKIFNFDNNIILLTGCNGQLGREISRMFLQNNAKVYGIDIVGKNLIKNKNFIFHLGDVSNTYFIKKVLRNIIKKENKINIIINNAAYQIFSDLKKRKDKENFDILNTNLLGPINIIKNYIPLHSKNKVKYCRIINIGSIYGSFSPDFSIYKKNDRFSSEIYGASKAGLIQISKYFAVLLAKKNITVNSISPGGIFNKEKQTLGFIKRYKANVPNKRMAETNDIISAIAMFGSEETSYTTGQNLIIDGGLSSK